MELIRKGNYNWGEENNWSTENVTNLVSVIFLLMIFIFWHGKHLLLCLVTFTFSFYLPRIVSYNLILFYIKKTLDLKSKSVCPCYSFIYFFMYLGYVDSCDYGKRLSMLITNVCIYNVYSVCIIFFLDFYVFCIIYIKLDEWIFNFRKA